MEITLDPCCDDPSPGFEPEREAMILGWKFKLYCEACDTDLATIIVKDKK